MAYKDQPSLASLQREWEKGSFKRVYLLGGTDTLAKEESVARLKNRFVGEDSSGMGVDIFDGNDVSGGAVLSAVKTLPFFGGSRLVILRRADQLSAADATLLADGLDDIPDTNTLVLLWDANPDARSVLVQSVRSAGALVVAWPPFENQMAGWILERAEGIGKRMDRAAAEALLDAVGPSLPDLAQELRKLALYIRDRPTITAQDVVQTVGERVTLRFMEWERAIWTKDREKALRLMETLRGQGEATPSLLSQVVRAVQRLCLGKALLADKTIPRISAFEKMNMKSRDIQSDFSKGADLWSWAEILRALDALVDTDMAVKSGQGSPDADLTRLVCGLTKGNG